MLAFIVITGSDLFGMHEIVSNKSVYRNITSENVYTTSVCVFACVYLYFFYLYIYYYDRFLSVGAISMLIITGGETGGKETTGET